MDPETCICIPTKRGVPIKTLESYHAPEDYRVLIIAGPNVYTEHQNYLKEGGYPGNVFVLPGENGMGAQSALCYVKAHEEGFKYFVRLDDDLSKRTFLHKEKDRYPELAEVIIELRTCLDKTNTTHAGLQNSTNRYWYDDIGVYKRSWGLVHGGTNIAISAPAGHEFMDPALVRGEDVYRTCAHRKLSGGIGRVGFIGFDKKQSTVTAGQTSIAATPEAILKSRDMILERFEGMVTCKGTRLIQNDSVEIVNWRMKKSKWDHA